MGRSVVVLRQLVSIRVFIPKGMGDDEFDDVMDSKYERIKEFADPNLSGYVHKALTDGEVRPLHGFDVRVEVS